MAGQKHADRASLPIAQLDSGKQLQKWGEKAISLSVWNAWPALTLYSWPLHLLCLLPSNIEHGSDCLLSLRTDTQLVGPICNAI